MKKTRLARLIVISCLAIFSVGVSADTKRLGTCLVDSVNGRERKVLVKWIFLSITAHPELEQYTKIESGDKERSDKETGALITRLFVKNCSAEIRAAKKVDPKASEKAYEFLWQVAMQELMSNQNVMAGFSSYLKYADKNGLNAILAD